VGSAIGEALQTFAVPYVVIERDPDIVKSLRTRGVPCLFGDAAGVTPDNIDEDEMVSALPRCVLPRASRFCPDFRRSA
jgi:hypothetical protein